jgi:hypothetical protein
MKKSSGIAYLKYFEIANIYLADRDSWSATNTFAFALLRDVLLFVQTLVVVFRKLESVNCEWASLECEIE